MLTIKFFRIAIKCKSYKDMNFFIKKHIFTVAIVLPVHTGNEISGYGR